MKAHNEATIRRNYYPTAQHEDAIIMALPARYKEARCNDEVLIFLDADKRYA